MQVGGVVAGRAAVDGAVAVGLELPQAPSSSATAATAAIRRARCGEI